MIKKVEVGVDALAVIALIVVVAFSFVGYQRYQYRDLLKETIECQWSEQDLEFEVFRLKALLEKRAQEEQELTPTK